MSPMKSHWMMQNSRISAFTLLDLLRGNQQLGGMKLPPARLPSPYPPRVGLKANYLLSKILKILCHKFFEIISTWKNLSCSGTNARTDKIKTLNFHPTNVFCIFCHMKKTWSGKGCQLFAIIIINCKWVNSCRLVNFILVMLISNLSNIVLIHFKPTFFISTPLKTSGQ